MHNGFISQIILYFNIIKNPIFHFSTIPLFQHFNILIVTSPLVPQAASPFLAGGRACKAGGEK
jgi:hypothetical protein